MTRGARVWGTFLLGHHRVVLLAGVIVSILAAAGLPGLGFEDSTRALRRSSAEDDATLARLHASFGDSKDLVVVLFEADNVLAAPVLEQSARLAREIEELEGVDWVFGIHDLTERDPLLATEPQRLLSHPLAKGHLVSEDAGELLLLARLRRSTSRSILDAGPTLTRIRAIAAASTVPGTSLSLTGTPYLRLETIESLRRSAITTNSLAFGLCLLVAVPLLRSWRRTVVALIGPSLAILWLLGGMGWAGVPLTPLSIVAPALVLAVGLTDSVHLIHAWDRARRGGRGAGEAVVSALDSALVPCLLTSLTTAIAFASLSLAELPLIRQFGWVCAGGSLLAGAAVLTLVPLLTGRGWLRAPGSVRSRGTPEWLSTSVQVACRRPWLATVVALALAFVLATAAAKLQSDYRIAEVLPTGSPAYAALEPIEAELGGAVWVDVLVTWPPGLTVYSTEVVDSLYSAHSVLEDQGVVHHPFSILTVLAATPLAGADALASLPPGLAAALVDPDNRRAVIQARIRDAGSRSLEPGFAGIERDLAQLEDQFPGFEITLTGSNLLTYRGIGVLIRDLRSSLLLALVLITVVLAVGLRSITAAIASLIPNSLPLLASAAVLYWLGEPLRFAAAMALTVGLGVAVDDSIHIAYSFLRQRRSGVSSTEAAAGAVRSLAPALTVSTLILVAGFAALLSHPMPQGRLFGAVAGMTLVWALVFDLLLLPPLLHLVSPRADQSRIQTRHRGRS